MSDDAMLGPLLSSSHLLCLNVLHKVHVRARHEALNDNGTRTGAAAVGICQKLVVPRSRNGHGPRLIVILIHERLGSPRRVLDDCFKVVQSRDLGKDLLVRDVISSLDPAGNSEHLQSGNSEW